MPIHKPFRSIRLLCQRLTRGWDDSETWNLDWEFQRWIYPRLLRFNELAPQRHVHSPELQAAIKTMLEGFDPDLPNDSLLEYHIKEQTLRRAYDAFSVWHGALWW